MPTQPYLPTPIEVQIKDESVWLNRQQLSLLFDSDIKTIGKHINNACKEELKGISVVAKFATTATDGKVYQMEHYNLDMILYRIQYTVTRQPITENRQPNVFIEKGELQDDSGGKEYLLTVMD